MATIFLFHVFVNVGMTMGIMPVTGIPLPFVSYGRSSLVVSVISLGLLQSIAMRSRAEVSKHPEGAERGRATWGPSRWSSCRMRGYTVRS